MARDYKYEFPNWKYEFPVISYLNYDNWLLKKKYGNSINGTSNEKMIIQEFKD